MLVSALLLLGCRHAALVRGSRRSRAGPAPWRQFPAQDGPRADNEGGADNHRRGERGEILQHEGSTSAMYSVTVRRVLRGHGAAT